MYGLGELFQETNLSLDQIIQSSYEDEEEGESYFQNFYTLPEIIPFKNKIVDIAVSKKINYSIYLDTGNNAYITGTYKFIPKENQPHHILSNVQYIYCSIHTCAFYMQNDGEVKVFGENSCRQISSSPDHIPVITKPKTISIEISPSDN